MKIETSLRALLSILFVINIYSCDKENEVSPTKEEEVYDVIGSFGQAGYGEDQFGFVALISIDDNDILYLSDTDQRNIKIYTVDGSFQGLLKSNVSSRAPIFVGDKIITTAGEDLVIEESGQLYIGVNTELNMVGQMAGNKEGYVYFAVNFNPYERYEHHRIYKYDLKGNLVTSWGEKGHREGQLKDPWGVSLYKGEVVVTCQSNPRAQFFTRKGKFIRSIDLSRIASSTYGNYIKDDFLYVACGSFVVKTDLEGRVIKKIGEGTLDFATSVVVDNEGNVIVADPYSRRIVVFKKR
jgi:hypothetical protein